MRLIPEHKYMVVVLLHACVSSAFACNEFNETFEDLEAWEELTFPNIDRHSEYSVMQRDGGSALRAESRASASGLVSRQSFDVYETPHLGWRWKVDNIYSNTNVMSREGDDYPIRIYVLFDYDPEDATLGQRIRYRTARALHGEYPPHSTLNYVWSSARETPDIYPSPYTDRSRMIPLRHGSGRVGEWVEESVHIVDDYRRAFGEDPPSKARIAIMNDSDDTGEAAVSWVDWIIVYQ